MPSPFQLKPDKPSKPGRLAWRWLGLLALSLIACQEPQGPTCGASSCQGGETCIGGLCQAQTSVCPLGSRLCGDRCALLTSDPEHCGACGIVCAERMFCDRGECRCWPETSLCGKACVRLQTDLQHCGSCGKACGLRQLCKGGKCVCWPGLESCGGECVDLQANLANCGACGAGCSSGKVCAAGRCVTSCPAATPKDCFGGCVDPKRDLLHCGACAATCPVGQSCFDGQCGCPPGQTPCQGACVDLQRESEHCGACEKACASGEICEKGTCAATCPDATPLACFGGCFDPQTDRRHCGGCGSACGLGETCKGGVCFCPQGWERCQGRCIDPLQDTAHCGGCGKSCLDREECRQGLCRMSEWAISLGSNHSDNLAKLVVDEEGSIYILGSFSGVMTFGQTSVESKGALDVYLLKLDRAGKFLWLQSFGSTQEDQARDVVLDNKGGVYITGDFRGTMQVKTATLQSVGDRDTFVMKWDTQGELIWAASFGSKGWDSGHRIAVDATGASYVVGRFNEQIQIGATLMKVAGSNDGYLVKIDPKGALEWGMALGGAASDDAYGVEVTKSGDIWVSGQFQQSMTIQGTKLQSKGGYDGFVLRFGADKTLLWSFSFGGSGGDSIRASVLDKDDNLFLVGAFGKTLTIDGKSYPNQGVDLLVAKFDPSGQRLWLQQVSSALDDEAGRLALDKAGNTFLTGTLAGAFQAGTIANPGQGGREAYLLKLDPAGLPVWGYFLEGGGTESGRSIGIDPKGGIVWGGTFGSTVKIRGRTFRAQGGNELFLMRFNETPSSPPP